MSTVTLINPRKRRKARRKSRARNPSAKQRANWARFAAASRARSKKRTTHKRRARRSNPANPRAFYARRSTRRARRRNPIGADVMSVAKPALFGAGGAILVQAASNMLAGSLPVQLQSGYGRHAANAALAFALGKWGGKALGQSAQFMAGGAMVVIAYQVLRDLAAQNGLNLGLSGLAYANPARTFVPRAAAALPNRMSGVGAVSEYYVNHSTSADSGAGSGMGEYVF
jgi:hypothetical protein